LKHNHWVGAGLLALGLVACAEPPATAANTSQALPTAVRLVIRFTTANSMWTTSDLAQLQTRLFADISPIAAVSENTWTYRVLPQTGQDLEKIIGILRTSPEVVQVDLGSKAHTH
jgi:hypothetical protein